MISSFAHRARLLGLNNIKESLYLSGCKTIGIRNRPHDSRNNAVGGTTAAALKYYYSTFDGIHPCIDVSPILQPNHPNRDQTISDLGKALKERGYFYAQNVNVLSEEYINSIYKYSNKIHNLPIDIKQQFSQRDGHGAYSGMDIGQAELDYDPGTTASVHAWDYSRTRFTLKKADDPDQNRYPGVDVVDPPYVDVLDDLYERQNILGRALMKAFAEALDLPDDAFVRMFDGTDCDNDKNEATTTEEGDFGTIRLLYYPGMDSESAQKANVGISAHTDFEVFTLMHQSAPGLQFLPPTTKPSYPNKPIEWVDAPVRSGEFVVIVGDALERCTNGTLKATPHRVIKTAHPRWSIIRFNAFASNTSLEPMAKFVSKDRPAAYSKVSMKVHMETTMKNLDLGLGAWDERNQRSLTANYVYVDGKDPKNC